jgi:hypothetical protein
MTALPRAIRRACLTLLVLLSVLPAAAEAAGREYKVLVFTRAVGEQHASTATTDPTEFRADGGPATGFGNLNWVEFSGPGIQQ